MARRFDRNGIKKIHMHSLGGMEHADYNAPGTYSYEQFMRVVLDLRLGYPALEDAFRRVCFNVMAVNQDDHVKNICFLMDDTGQWRLAPAHDQLMADRPGRLAEEESARAWNTMDRSWLAGDTSSINAF
jgi:serine/threonine-protein kinase HipA